MKKVLLFCLTLCCSILLWAQIPPQPNPPRLVNDFAGVLTSEQVNELENRLVAFNDSTSNVICVVIVNDLGDYDAAEYAYEIGDKWGVKDKKFNNGVVILIKPSSPKGGDGDIYIATGYDVEGVLPDAACKRIIEQQFIPELKEGHYYEALVKGLDVILPALAGEINVARNDGEDGPYLFGFTLFLLIMIIILIVSASRSSHNRKGRGGSGDGNGNNEDLLNAIFWGTLLSSGHRGGSGFSGSSGFGGGFHGGGFGGFGGSGGFGGGGAGGRF